MRSALLVGIAIILSLLGAELGLRGYQKATKGVPFSAPPSMQFDSVLGWKGDGVFGDPLARRRKLVFVGDSCTLPLGGLDIASMCYSVLGRTLDTNFVGTSLRPFQVSCRNDGNGAASSLAGVEARRSEDR